MNKLSAFLQRPPVQAILWRACGASGFIGMFLAKVCHYFGFPVPEPDMTTVFLTGFIVESAEWLAAWYRNNPNNMLRRLANGINGDLITGDTKAAVAEAASTIPGVVVHVDTSSRSLAPLAVQALANSPTPDVVPKPTPGG